MSENYPVDGELRRQVARFEALEQAHAELAAKADALTPNDEGMHTLPEKTAAQERYHEANERHYSNREVEMAAGAFDRAEEVAQELDDWTHLIHMRLNTLSQGIAAINPAPVVTDEQDSAIRHALAYLREAGNDRETRGLSTDRIDQSCNVLVAMLAYGRDGAR